jgi:hypothetical protein
MCLRNANKMPVVRVRCCAELGTDGVFWPDSSGFIASVKTTWRSIEPRARRWFGIALQITAAVWFRVRRPTAFEPSSAVRRRNKGNDGPKGDVWLRAG